MKTVHKKLKVISNEKTAEDIYILELELDEEIEILPGQFLQLSLGEHLHFLRRPFSIFDCGKDNIKILYKLRGNVTRFMRELKKYRVVDVIFPLGNGFPYPHKGKVTLISGGTGFAPLHFLVKKLVSLANLNIEFIIGTRSKEAEEFKKLLPPGINITIVTEDGSVGEKGLVTDSFIPGECFIYCAGPRDMLRAVYEKIKDKNTPAYFSFESHFACGMGFCWGCVLPTQDGFLRVCKDGPVFSPYIVKWEEI